MKIFNKKGEMKFPKPETSINIKDKEEYIKECFCSNGHNLVSNRIKFDSYNGIMVRIKNDNKNGLLGLSPVCGCKSRITLDVEPQKGEMFEFYCPECEVQLPVYGPCPECGGNLITFFLDTKKDFKYCIGVCNRVDCTHAEIRTGEELRACTSLRLTKP